MSTVLAIYAYQIDKGESNETWFKCIVVESDKWQLNDENCIENLVIATDFNTCYGCYITQNLILK